MKRLLLALVLSPLLSTVPCNAMEGSGSPDPFDLAGVLPELTFTGRTPTERFFSWTAQSQIMPLLNNSEFSPDTFETDEERVNFFIELVRLIEKHYTDKNYKDLLAIVALCKKRSITLPPYVRNAIARAQNESPEGQLVQTIESRTWVPSDGSRSVAQVQTAIETIITRQDVSLLTRLVTGLQKHCSAIFKFISPDTWSQAADFLRAHEKSVINHITQRTRATRNRITKIRDLIGQIELILSSPSTFSIGAFNALSSFQRLTLHQLINPESVSSSHTATSPDRWLWSDQRFASELPTSVSNERVDTQPHYDRGGFGAINRSYHDRAAEWLSSEIRFQDLPFEDQSPVLSTETLGGQAMLIRDIDRNLMSTISSINPEEDASVKTLREYLATCRERGITPSRYVMAVVQKLLDQSPDVQLIRDLMGYTTEETDNGTKITTKHDPLNLWEEKNQCRFSRVISTLTESHEVERLEELLKAFRHRNDTHHLAHQQSIIGSALERARENLSHYVDVLRQDIREGLEAFRQYLASLEKVTLSIPSDQTTTPSPYTDLTIFVTWLEKNCGQEERQESSSPESSSSVAEAAAPQSPTPSTPADEKQNTAPNHKKKNNKGKKVAQ